jgi:citrate synthase
MEKRDWLSAREAVGLLDVKLATLYSYVSRGLVQSVPSRAAHGRLYARADVERLKARHDARAGHAAVAAGALRWGEPALETQISDIRADGPYYRGISALALLERARSFECAAELVWTGVLPTGVRWPRGDVRTTRQVPARSQQLTRLALEVGELSLHDKRRRDSQGAELARGRWLLSRLAGAEHGDSEPAIAAGLLKKLGGRPSKDAIQRLDRALVLCIDHELNASTFTARVAASAGSELFACIAAGLHTLSGNAHGGVSARVEALIDEIVQKKSVKRVLRSYLAQGTQVPGFGHRLYPTGDPRCRALLTLAEDTGRGARRLEALRALVEVMHDERQLLPNLDLGLVALSLALDLRPCSTSSVFAIGRIAGFIAHILEQRAQGYLLRPRARYIGG